MPLQAIQQVSQRNLPTFTKEQRNENLRFQPNVPDLTWTQPAQQVPNLPFLPNQQVQQTTVPQTSQKRYFSDEQVLVNQMLQDGYTEDIARQTIVNRRNKYLKKTKVEPVEAKMLMSMADAGFDMPSAVQILKDFRKDIRDKNYEELNFAQKRLKNLYDTAVSTLAWWVWELWWFVDFVSQWKIDLWKQSMEARSFQREVSEWSKSATVWDFLWAWIMDYYAWKWLWKVTWVWKYFWTWPKSLSMTKQFIWAWAWYWAATQIWEKWAETTMQDIATWSAVWAAWWAVLWKTLPIIWRVALKWVQKWVKYWTAWVKWWVKWLGKSVYRDIKRPIIDIQKKGFAPKLSYETSTKANRFRKAAEEEFKSKYWMSTWEFAVKKWMTKTWDDAVFEATKNWKASMKEADDMLEMIDWVYKLPKSKGTDYMKLMLDDLETRLIKSAWKEAKKVWLLNKKYTTKWLSMTEINDVKRMYARNFKYPKDKMWSTKFLKSKNIQDWVREWQFKIAKKEWLINLDKINKNTQAWKFYADNLASNMAWKEPNMRFGITDWIALSWWEPTNIALYLWKKIWESTAWKRWVISKFAKQTEQPIVKWTTGRILQSNLRKENVRISNILSDRISGKSTPIYMKPRLKALPPWKTQEWVKTVITESKKPIKLQQDVTKSRPVQPKTTKKPETPKKTTPKQKKVENVTKTPEKPKTPVKAKETVEKTTKPVEKKPTSTKALGKWAYINPWKIVEDVKTNLSKLTPKNIATTAWNIAKQLWVEVKKVVPLLKWYVKKYWEKLKDKLAEIFDDLADKLWVRSKLFGWEWAMRAPVTTLEKAKNMALSWKQAKTIWKETWWTKWKDWKWRFEIDDSKAIAEIPPKVWPKKLSDILRHDELYKQYPELKDVKVVFRLKPDSKVLWTFYPEKNLIHINAKNVWWLDEYFWAAKPLSRKDLETLLHEIQHKIQKVEWFAWWTSKEQAWGIASYLKSAWEVEARNVERRINLTKKARRNFTPESTWWVPFSQQKLDKSYSIAKNEWIKKPNLITKK